MTSQASLGYGNAIPGEADCSLIPKYYDTDEVGVIYCHGAGGLAAQVLDAQYFEVCNALATVGHPVISCDLGGLNTWGNETVVSRISQAKHYLHTVLKARGGKVILVGGSMGGLSCFAWAARNPLLTAAVIGIVPVSDVTDMHDNNRSGLAASIDSAYPGGWYEDTYGAQYNPVTMALSGAFSTVPMMLLASNADVTVLPSTVAMLADRAGPLTQLVVMEGDHGTFTIPIATVNEFAAQYAS